MDPPMSKNGSLWPSDAIWGQRSGSTLAQVMACCLMAPSHYLNQCWLITNGALWYSPYKNFTGSAWDISSWYEFENYDFEIKAISPMGQWVKFNHTLLELFHWYPMIRCDHKYSYWVLAPRLQIIYTDLTDMILSQGRIATFVPYHLMWSLLLTWLKSQGTSTAFHNSSSSFVLLELLHWYLMGLYAESNHRHWLRMM